MALLQQAWAYLSDGWTAQGFVLLAVVLVNYFRLVRLEKKVEKLDAKLESLAEKMESLIVRVARLEELLGKIWGFLAGRYENFKLMMEQDERPRCAHMVIDKTVWHRSSPYVWAQISPLLVDCCLMLANAAHARNRFFPNPTRQNSVNGGGCRPAPS